ncbi:MAG: GDP-mannose 4,6-dehydratase [Bacteroidia bacterium]|nr:GDP-mannose 4,6-dehydratase [Bacteroidia bacterium]
MIAKCEKVLITGGAGFIGSNLADSLLTQGCEVTVLDNLEPFYDVAFKRQNIAANLEHPRYTFIEGNILDPEFLEQNLGTYDVIVHLAAKAGVRPSILNPVSYQETNVRGTQNMLEFAKNRGIVQFVFASSSSVYGINPNVPWSESDYVLQPISPYASTKVSGELLGHVYSHLYGIRFIGLRFFTVYGPRQRPDLAIHKFARMMMDGQEIPVFGDGSTRRDYTFVRDIVAGIQGAMTYDGSMFEVVNLGNNNTVSLTDMISTIEEVFGIEARIKRMPMQPGDVPQTFADVQRGLELFGYKPETGFKEGIEAFRAWITSEEIQALTMPSRV